MSAQQSAVWHKLFLVSGVFATQRTRADSLAVRQTPPATQNPPVAPPQQIYKAEALYPDTADERTHKN